MHHDIFATPSLNLSCVGLDEQKGVDPEQYPIGSRVLYHGNLSLSHGGYAEKAIVTAKAVSCFCFSFAILTVGGLILDVDLLFVLNDRLGEYQRT